MDSVIIIAEAGVNHNGELERALQLIREAASAGADYIKFQTFKAEKLVSKKAIKAEYQKHNTGDSEQSQLQMLKALEIPDSWYKSLLETCAEEGIQFLSTGFDEESVDFLDQMNPKFHKIPSGEITNKPYLEHIARKGKKIVLSTGMATLGEISDAIQIFENHNIDRSEITVLHCTTDYPTAKEDVNLKAMQIIGTELNVSIGYSDHTLGIEVPIAAVALGAQLIEKHFTLDRNLPGPDHRASLEPAELKAMVSGIRNIELALSGSGVKEPTAHEIKNISIARKSIHTRKKLSEGHVLRNEDLIMKRPGDGISPMNIDQVLGKTLNLNLEEESKIDWSHLK